MSQSWTWPPVEWSDGAVEAMKWLGLVLMTADHAQKYGLMPAVPGVYEAGRMAFPLFGIVVAPQLPGNLRRRVYIMSMIESRRPFWKIKATAVFLLGGALVEFWWPGVALCVGAWLYCKQPTGGAFLLWIAGTAGLTLINGNGWACASFVVLAAMASLFTIEIPRASRWFYLYYPAHFGIILLLGFRIQSPS